MIILIVPAIAEEPNKAEPPPRITSTRSIILAGICSSPYTPERALNTGRESIRICVYGPSRPLMRTCWKPQFWQFVSTRTPGWKFSPCDKVEELVVSKSFRSTTFTKVGAIRRVVSLRLAETTTPSRAIASSSISKSSSSVFPFFRVTLRVTVL